jgi:hypothetical protein
VEFNGGGDPLDYVISRNLQRRHLNETQRGMVAAKKANMKSGTRTDLGASSTQVSREEAADLLGVSKGTGPTSSVCHRGVDATKV